MAEAEGDEVVRDLQASFEKTEGALDVSGLEEQQEQEAPAEDAPVEDNGGEEATETADNAEEGDAPAEQEEGAEGEAAPEGDAVEAVANEGEPAEEGEAAPAQEEAQEGTEADSVATVAGTAVEPAAEEAAPPPVTPPAAPPAPPAPPAPTPPGPAQRLLERLERPNVLATTTAQFMGPDSPERVGNSKTPRQAGGQSTKQRWAPQHVTDLQKTSGPSPSPIAVKPMMFTFAEGPRLRTANSPSRASRALGQSGTLPGGQRKPLDVYAMKGMRLAQSEQLKGTARGNRLVGQPPNPGVTPEVQQLLTTKRTNTASAPVPPRSIATSRGVAAAQTLGATTMPRATSAHANATSRVGTAAAPSTALSAGQPDMESLTRAASKFPGTIHLSSQLSAAPGQLVDDHLSVADHISMSEEQIVGFHQSRGFSFDGSSGTFVTDPQFPPNVHSLFPDPEHPPPQGPLASEWLRCRGHFYTRFWTPQLKWDARLNNLWFVNAVAALSCHEDLILSSFVSDDMGANGLYTFQFFKQGHWVPITVDDHIPYEPGRDHPQFLRSDRIDHNGDIWPCLLEKAYAKLRGSYFGMDGAGTTAQALGELTGNPVQRIVMEPQEAQEGVESPWLAQFESWLKRGDTLVTKVSAPTLVSDGMVAHSCGVYYNHAYTILGVERRSGQANDAMIKCYNPWRGGMYVPPVSAKRFSDFDDSGSTPASPEPGMFASEVKTTDPMDDTSDLESNCFYIHANAFFSIFNRVHRVVHVPSSWNQVSLRGAWFGKTAGGPPALGDQPNGAFCANPQYRITSRKKCDVIVHISLKDPNMTGVPGSEDTPRVVVRPPRFEVIALSSDTLDYSRKFLTNPRELLCHEAQLTAGGLDLSASFQINGNVAAVMVPYTEAPGIDSAFSIRIFASQPIEVEELTPPEVTSIVSGWDALTSGGAPGDATWGSNPQFLLQPTETTKIMVQIEPADPSKPSHILDDDEDDDATSYYNPMEESIGLGSSHRFNQSTGLPRPGHTGGSPEASGRPTLDKPISSVSNHGREPLGGEPSRANSTMSTATGYGRVNSTSTHRSSQSTALPVPLRSAQRRQMAMFVCKPTELQGGGLGRRLFLSSSMQEVLAQTSWVRLGQQTSLSIVLTGGVPVVIAPTIRSPGITGRFKLSVYSQTPLQVFELPASRTVTLPGEWTEVKSGGCDLHKTFKKNPAFVLTVKGRGPVQLSVSRADKTGSPLQAVGLMGDKGIDRMTGFYVFEAAKPPSRGQGGVLPNDALGPRVFESSFVPTVLVTGEVVLGTAAPETIYYVLVATYSPNQLGKFLLTATSGVDLELTEYVQQKGGNGRVSQA